MAFLLTGVKRLFNGSSSGGSSVISTEPRTLPARPLTVLAILLLLIPFFYGLPYTDIALRLGFLCLLTTVLFLCHRAPRHHRWRKFYCAVFAFFRRLALWLYLCPFLLLPLFYGSLWLAAQYYCFATDAFAHEDPGKGLEELFEPPKPKRPPLLQPGALHQIVIEADGTMFTATADPRAGLDFKIPPGKRAVWVPIDMPNGRRVYHFALGGPDGPEEGDLFYETHAKKAPPEPLPPRIYHYALGGIDDPHEGGRFYWLYRGDKLPPADRFEKRLAATGVTLAEFDREMDSALASLLQERGRIVGLLPQLAGELGLPPLAPPRLVAPGPLHPDYSRGGWADWGHHVLVTLLKPVLLTDLSKVQKQPDVGLSGPLLYPSAQWPFLLDVRCTAQEGFSVNLSWRSDSGHGGRATKDPFFFQLTEVNRIAPQPVYYPPLTEEILHQRGWDPMTEDERTYVTGVHRLTDFVEQELPSGMADLSSQRASIKTLSQAYDLLADIRLKEAELSYRGHFSVIKPATRVLELWFDVQRTQMDIMRLWFCREHTFSRTGCPEWFQSGERQTDARVLYSTMGRYSDSGQFNHRQGHLGRLSFFPFSEQPPYKTEGGTVMRYWDCYDRPPLARDQQQQSWEELLVKVKAGKAHIDKKDVFKNGLGPGI